MKQLKIKLLLAVSILFLVNACYAQTWNKKADFSGAEKYGAYSFSVNNKVYVGGGQAIGGPSKDLHEYDPATDKWTAKAGMPQNMSDGIAFTINGKAYAGLGTTGGSYLKKLWQYDDANDTWIQKAELPYFSGVFRSRVFVINNKAYVLIGTASNLTTQNLLYEYDPATDVWTLKADYPNNTRPDLPFAFAIGNKGYVSCGKDAVKNTYEYDPATDKWTPKADFPGDARQMGVSFTYNGKGYCGLGTYRDPNFISQFTDDFYIYDPATDSWSAGPAFPGGKIRRATAVIAGSNAYVGTGESSSGATKTWYEFGLPLSINDIKANNTISVHPNPSSGLVVISHKDVANKDYTIYNSLGQPVQSGNIPSSRTLDVNKLPIGIYTLQVSTKKELLKARIMVK